METFLIELHNKLLHHIFTEPIFILAVEALIVVCAYIVLELFNLYLKLWFVPKSKHGYSRIIESAPKFLIAGDSTAVGTGAKHLERSLAGFLAHDFPNMSIKNVAVNGALTRAVLRQLSEVEDEKFDTILISIGGNDVWTFNSIARVREDIRDVIVKAKEICTGEVILVFFGNEGSSPFFPLFLRTILMIRTKKILEVFKEVSGYEKVPLVELFTQKEGNPFATDPEKFFARDGLHPSDAGYWEWYKRLWQILIESGYSSAVTSLYSKKY